MREAGSILVSGRRQVPGDLNCGSRLEMMPNAACTRVFSD